MVEILLLLEVLRTLNLVLAIAHELIQWKNKKNALSRIQCAFCSDKKNRLISG